MKRSIIVKQKKRGRPATGEMPFVGIRLPQPLIDQIDAWSAAAGEDVTRSEAIRRLVELGLKAKGARPMRTIAGVHCQ